MVHVIKADGRREPFSEEKVINSIHRAGIPKDIQQDVLKHIKDRLYDEITTQEIYHHISEFLGKSKTPFLKAPYTLKRAIMELGPTGYPFEDFLARLLTAEGYQTKTRTILQGKCISHEIDVIAVKGNKKIMVEAKFHNAVGITTNVHVPMYTKSRFEDVKVKHNFDEVWVVTNTKATTEAIAFAQCVGMNLISWSYPEKESLRELIEKYHLHPITVLSSLNMQQKAQLLNNDIVVCGDIVKNPHVLNLLETSQMQKDTILQEATSILGPK